MEHNNNNDAAILEELQKLIDGSPDLQALQAEFNNLDLAAQADSLKAQALDGLPLTEHERPLLMAYINEQDAATSAATIDGLYLAAAKRLMKQDSLVGEAAELSEAVMDMIMVQIVLGNAMRYENGFITREQGGLSKTDAVVIMDAYCDGLLACEWKLDMLQHPTDPTKMIVTTSITFHPQDGDK